MNYFDRFSRWTTVFVLVFWALVLMLGGTALWPYPMANLRNTGLLAIVLGLALAGLQKPRHLELLKKVESRGFHALVIFVLVALAFKGTLFSFYSFSTNAYDFSLFQGIIPNSLEGRWGQNAVSTGNHFGVHPTYVLFLVAPLQMLTDSSLVLILLHGLLISLAIFCYDRWLKKLRYTHFERSMMLMALMSFYIMGRVALSDFRAESFYPLFGFLFLMNFFSGSFLALMLSLIAFLSVKEDAAGYAIAFSVGIMATRGLQQGFLPRFVSVGQSLQRAGAVFAVSATILILNVKIIVPMAQNRENAHVPGYLAKYGSSMADMILGILSNPADLFRLLSNPIFLSMSVCLLGLHLLPLWCVLPTAAYLVLHFLSESPVMNTLGAYYGAPLVPILFIGTSYALWRITESNALKDRRLRLVFAHFVLCLTIGGGYYSLRGSPADPSDFYTLARRIHDDGKICVQSPLMPHLGFRTDYELLTKSCVSAPETRYILLNKNLSTFPHEMKDFEEFIESIESSGQFDNHHLGGFDLYIRRD